MDMDSNLFGVQVEELLHLSLNESDLGRQNIREKLKRKL